MKLCEAVDIALQHGFLTGSRVDGSAQLESDYDIVIPAMYKTQIIGNFMEDGSINTRTDSDYTGGILIGCISNISINLIPVSLNDYRAWYYTTLAMQSMWKYTGITHKEQKIAIFESMRASFRGRMVPIVNHSFDMISTLIATEARTDTIFLPTTWMLERIDGR